MTILNMNCQDMGCLTFSLGPASFSHYLNFQSIHLGLKKVIITKADGALKHYVIITAPSAAPSVNVSIFLNKCICFTCEQSNLSKDETA